MSDIESAAAALRKAEAAYNDVKAEYDECSRRMTTAKNYLNECRKKFDAAVAVTKKAAPRDSFWLVNRHKCEITDVS